MVIDYLADTNVLLRWFHTPSPHHPVAVAAIDAIARRGDRLVITPRNLVEFWSVATRPPLVNGLGLDPATTEAVVQNFELTFPLLQDNPAIHPEWRRLVSLTGARGKQVHDARIAALMRVHGVGHLLTFNGDDFARYPGVVAVDPASLAAGP
jgi:predicted nucleic acid-binding protein